MLYFQRQFWSLYGRFVWDDLIKPWRASHIQQVVRILQQRKVKANELVLDAGCGTGNFALALAQAGFQVVGIDFAFGMLKRAKAKLTTNLSKNLLFEQSDLNIPLHFSDNKFDHIIHINVLQTIINPKFTLNEFHRVLKPDGTLVLLFMRKSYGSIRNIIQKRIDCLRSKNIWKLMLILFKTFGERIYPIKDWSAEELKKIVASNKFDIVTVDSRDLPIIIVAHKAPE